MKRLPVRPEGLKNHSHRQFDKECTGCNQLKRHYDTCSTCNLKLRVPQQEYYDGHTDGEDIYDSETMDYWADAGNPEVP